MRRVDISKKAWAEAKVGIRSYFSWEALLRLDDLAGLDATGADANALVRCIHPGLHCLQIDVPPPPRDVVGVRDVVAELRLLAANFTYLCHIPVQYS